MSLLKSQIYRLSVICSGNFTSLKLDYSHNDKKKNANKALNGSKLDGNEELKILVTQQRIDDSFYLSNWFV